MAWSDLETYWSAQVNTAETAGQISEPDAIEARVLLSRWIDAEEAKDKAAAAADIQSYSIHGRSVQRATTQSSSSAATTARRDFFHKLYGSSTYADFRTNQEVTDDI